MRRFLVTAGAGLAAIALAAPAQAVTDAELRRALDRRMDAAGPASGAYVYDVTGKRVLYRRRAGTPRSLASNTKLFTTAAALDRFGAPARLRTTLWRVGELVPEPGGETEPGPADEGLGAAQAADRYALEGDLYLRGGGDPALGSRPFANRYLDGLVTRTVALADRVRRSGIRRVNGRLYADDTLFDRLRGVPYSGWRLTGYIGPLSALSYNSGFAGDLQRRFAPDPARFAVEQLRDALRRRGIRVTRGVALRRLPPSASTAQSERGRALVASVSSPKIAELIAETNRRSNNFFAEMLLKGVGARYGGGGTTVEGAAVVRAFARGVGSRVRARDGSGLTYSNAASPRAVARLLLAMLDHPAYASFFGSLPIAGRQGTLHDRMRGTAAQDACRAKTGTLNGISTLSGYCRTRGDREVVFSFLMNGVNVYRARKLQDSMTALVARYRG